MIFFFRVKQSRRPEGMHREVFALLYKDSKDAPPLLPTDTGKRKKYILKKIQLQIKFLPHIGLGYKQTKARLGMKKVRKWEWSKFSNAARTDGVQFCHWQRISDEPKEYPFAALNRKLNIPTYTVNEYNTHLRNNTKWNKLQTDYLFELAQRFDTRFIIMGDRWDRDKYGIKTVEDLKERYYEVTGILQKLRGGANADKKIYVFDGEHERKRKEQLKKLFDRTQAQIEEETMLQNELRKIEARKKEREKKTQDLQKLISQADQQNEQATAATPQARKQEKKLNRKKVPVQQKVNKDVVTSMETATIRFGEGVNKGMGIAMRSQKMKLPANFGQKRTKALEQILAEFKVDPNPPATEEICTAFNDLRSDMILLNEIRTALAASEFELETLKQVNEIKQEIAD
jgi:DNA methyltransferase 1-associated protein 1